MVATESQLLLLKSLIPIRVNGCYGKGMVAMGSQWMPSKVTACFGKSLVSIEVSDCCGNHLLLYKWLLDMEVMLLRKVNGC
jgi:hypothetical protein